MSVAEVKRKLILKIKKSQDNGLLNDIYGLMKDESKTEPFLLSQDQLVAIREGEKQIKEGNYLTDLEVRKRTAKWLGK